MPTTEIYLNTNITTGETYNRNGDFFRDGDPQFPYKSSFRMIWQLYTSTPDANMDGTKPEDDWTKADFTGCGALLTCDNDFIHRLTGTLKIPVNAGAAVTSLTVTVPNGNDTNIPAKGYITVADSSGGRIELAYSAVTFSGADAELTIGEWTPSASLSEGAKVKISQEAYFQAPYNADLSDPANGRFVFDCVVYSNKLAEQCDAATSRTIDVMGIEILPFTVGEDNIYKELPSYICETAAIVVNMGEAGQNPQETELISSTVGAIVDQKTAGKFSAIDSRVTALEDAGYITGAELSAGLAVKADSAAVSAVDSRLTALSGTVAGKVDNPSGGSAGQVLTKTDGGVQWTTVEGGGGSSGGEVYVTPAELSSGLATKADTSTTSAIDSRVTALQTQVSANVTAISGKITDPAGGSAGQVLTRTADGGAQWSTVSAGSSGGVDSAGVLSIVSSGGYTTSATVTGWLSSKADTSTVSAIDSRVSAAEGNITTLSGSVAGKMDAPSGGSAGQVLTKTSGGGVQWSTPASGGLDSAGVLSAVSSAGYITSNAVNNKLDMYVPQSTYGVKMNEITLALDGKASTEELTAVSSSLNAAKADVSSVSAINTRVTVLENTGLGGTIITTTDFDTLMPGSTTKRNFGWHIPVGILTDKGNYYPVEKGSLEIVNGTDVQLDVSPYLAYDNSSSFTGTWKAFFATGTSGAQVLEWIAPDPDNVMDIPAWNVIYMAGSPCWISVSFLGGTTGGVMIGKDQSTLNGTPYGMWVGADGVTGEYMTVFCPKGWYYQAYLANASAPLSYSHKKIYKCKGA